jgi:hypothetical protein
MAVVSRRSTAGKILLSNIGYLTHVIIQTSPQNCILLKIKMADNPHSIEETNRRRKCGESCQRETVPALATKTTGLWRYGSTH